MIIKFTAKEVLDQASLVLKLIDEVLLKERERFLERNRRSKRDSWKISSRPESDDEVFLRLVGARSNFSSASEKYDRLNIYKLAQTCLSLIKQKFDNFPVSLTHEEYDMLFKHMFLDDKYFKYFRDQKE